jgi:DNA-binding Lrp family transcriptional regulator
LQNSRKSEIEVLLPDDVAFSCDFYLALNYDFTMEAMDTTLDTIDLKLLNLLQADAAGSNQDLAAAAHVSPATALRRVRRLVESGVIERQIAIVSPAAVGAGLTALVEVTLDRQGAEHLDEFETLAVADAGVQQCYRVSPGPDFMLVVHASDMEGYHALTQRLFTQNANVRNVKAFFSVKRAKFEPRVALRAAPAVPASPASPT